MKHNPTSCLNIVKACIHSLKLSTIEKTNRNNQINITVKTTDAQNKSFSLDKISRINS